ncbi:MAG: hypothetical protein P8R42_07885 [Candidatus Binatia bacterium]|nr:hypothetical protein [Candidatus Binatia bacterium]
MCFGIRDSARIRAQLQVETSQFGSFDGKIAKKSIEPCVPAGKLLGEVRDVSMRPNVPIGPLPVGGVAASSEYLRYKLTGKKSFPTDHPVVDQFGLRIVDKLKVKRLYEDSFGYAVFDSRKTSFMIGTAFGAGVAVERAAGTRTYMQMATGGINVGMGAQWYQVVFLF